MELKFEGLNEFSEKIQKVIDKYPGETEEELKKLGKDLKKGAKDRTPKLTGKLKKGYKLSSVTYSRKGNSYITLTNTNPHFHLIEKGHRQTDAKGNAVGKGFVPGKHMLENAVTELQGEMPDKLNTWADHLLGDTQK